jgi:hypothetical protein
MLKNVNILGLVSCAQYGTPPPSHYIVPLASLANNIHNLNTSERHITKMAGIYETLHTTTICPKCNRGCH